MPRYFFNYRANGVLEKDPKGSDLPTNKAAIREAELGAREVASRMFRGM